MSRGFLIFAHNNEQLDYGLIAMINALMIKSNLVENKVALATDEGTATWLRQQYGEMFSHAFDHVIVLAWDDVHSENTRRFNDTPYTHHVLPWRNSGRVSAYDISPFDETILIDADYLVQDRTLDLVWETQEDLAMNRVATSLEHKPPHVAERFLNPFTIPLYWATCLFFRKGHLSSDFFTLVRNARANYALNRVLYGFPGGVYRNDYAFSIAAHLIGGQIGNGIAHLPAQTLLTSFDRDDIHDVPARNEIIFLVNDVENEWRFRVSRVSGINVHVMNKFAIVRHAKKFLDLYGAA
jgi:hypothetical protein